MSIEINKLQLGYQDKTIVRDLSLTFPSNQIIALIGPNGCGKSTTLKAVARLLKPRLGTRYLAKHPERIRQTISVLATTTFGAGRH